MYPKIYLAMDNCAFYKRWTTPIEWSRKMAELGIYYVEASADTELDPLFMGKDYLNDWIINVRNAEKETGVRVANLYSGHGTYMTLGMAHDDKRVREHLINDWFFPMTEIAGKLGCGLGFFAHAFKHNILQSKQEYYEYVEILCDALARINEHAGHTGCGLLGIEQMYTPHQFPCRMSDTEFLLKEITKRSGRNFYFTEDLGHHSRNFFRPEKYTDGCWLGSDRAFDLYDKFGQSAWNDIEKDMDDNPQLFAEKGDEDCYRTLANLGCYSPIIHLQQTTGNRSKHDPFTDEFNATGVVRPDKVLNAIKESYDKKQEQGMPDKCSEIYLTLELFSGTTTNMHSFMKECKTSVEYWRNYIPKDGVTIDELT